LFAAHHAQKDIVKNLNHSLSGGKLDWVLEAIRRFGSCDAALVNQAIEKEMNGQSNLFSEIQLLQMVEYGEVLLERHEKKNVTSRPFRDILLNTSIVANGDPCLWTPELFDEKWLNSQLEPLVRGRLYDQLFTDLVKVCEGRTFPAKLPPTVFIKTPFSNVEPSRPVDFVERVASAFKSVDPPIRVADTLEVILGGLTSSMPQPVGINYCVEILTDTTYRLVGENSSPGTCGGHSSVILGSRTHNGRCQLLLYNSWGNSYPHSPQWQEKRDNHGRLIGIWIDAESLIQSTAGFEMLR
jgi:hypothetical protein